MRSSIESLMLAGALALGSPLGLAAQQSLPGCTGRVSADLGFSGMSFNQGTTYVTSHLMLFGTEPVLTGVEPNGPAAGKLKDGDVLVAVNGALITTRAGALHFAGVRPKVPVVLTVRRGGRNLDVRIVPGTACVPDIPRVPEAPAAPAPTTAPAAAGIPAPPTAPTAAAPGPPPPPRLAANGSGLLGVGLSCNCALYSDANGSERWSFREPPRVEAVGRGSAAERSGLKVGDRIERVDGLAITTAEGGHRFGAIKPGQRVRLGILRGTSRLEVTLVAQR